MVQLHNDYMTQHGSMPVGGLRSATVSKVKHNMVTISWAGMHCTHISRRKSELARELFQFAYRAVNPRAYIPRRQGSVILPWPEQQRAQCLAQHDCRHAILGMMLCQRCQ